MVNKFYFVAKIPTATRGVSSSLIDRNSQTQNDVCLTKWNARRPDGMMLEKKSNSRKLKIGQEPNTWHVATAYDTTENQTYNSNQSKCGDYTNGLS
jgi:hypothetical protein